MSEAKVEKIKEAAQKIAVRLPSRLETIANTVSGLVVRHWCRDPRQTQTRFLYQQR